MARKKKTDDTPPKAADLLPPDGPAPVDPKSVVRADDPLEPDVETRKIGIRRVSSLEFGNRMYARLNRRSAGNSRDFWRNMEADDPFLRAPARPTDAPLEIYPAQRLERTSGSQPKPQPDVAREYPPPSRQEEAVGNRPPQPRREAQRPKRTPPEETHTPEPRPAPRPPPRAREPEPEPEVAPEPVPVAPVAEPPQGRRLPPKPPGGGETGTGRIRTGGGRQRMPSRAGAEQQQKSAAEIRAEKQRARDIAMEKEPAIKNTRSLDAYRDFVQMMEIQREAFERGEDVPTAFADEADEPVRRPKPLAEAKREREPEPVREPVREPEPEPPPPAVDRRPPMPKKEAPPAPINRSPSGAGAGGGLDDLFGGGQQEGRVRIGKRAKPKEPGEDEKKD
ncbi:MAG: hypothetical protein H6737_19090 [Alphaproteobacteria bacterium]|nr:hypothetical protein [Alphaproteobacteria bacterium]